MPPKAAGPRTDLAGAFAGAFRVDAVGEPREAVARYLGLLDAAARAEGDPLQVPAIEAALDALVTRTMPSLGETTAMDAALVYRTREPIAKDLIRIAGEARGPFARGLVARALSSLAERQGDATQAETWRTAGGCAREALVIGPTTWAALTGVAEHGPLDEADARIEASYATDDAFGRVARPLVVRGRGCAIALSVESARSGVREVVVDVEVPRPQTIGLALRAHGAASLRAGGSLVLTRPFELGDGEAPRFGSVGTTAGTLRIVARVGTAKEDDVVELDAWGEDGAPLKANAPSVGSKANARVLRSTPLVRTVAAGADTGATARREDDTLLRAATAVAEGSAHEAERVLWPEAARADAPAALALMYARAVETARDLSVATRAERARGAYSRVLEAWPNSWEAVIAHAVLAGIRRGRDEGGIETLRDLDAHRSMDKGAKTPVLDAFDGLVSGRQHLYDRARGAIDRARSALGGSALFADAMDASTPAAGVEQVAVACNPARSTGRNSLACFDARRAVGDRTAALAELARVRAVLGAPMLFLSLELRERLLGHDEDGARRIFDAMLPAERTLAELSELSVPEPAEARRTALLRLAPSAADAPVAVAPLLRALDDDPAREFAGVAERLAAQDRESPILPSAATAVFTHVERYDVSAAGLVRW
ncbi:MAG: hypothetical protein M3O50_09885, partial [Myxococcota bacterium]|nr:hypothetical protein [Myxococcota bacterium]